MVIWYQVDPWLVLETSLLLEFKLLNASYQDLSMHVLEVQDTFWNILVLTVSLL